MQLPFLEPDEPFPPAHEALGVSSGAAGLLCAGADLSVQRLQSAYAQGVFPWFSQGQPILWWSPDPRMVLRVENFRLHRSLRKTCERWLRGGAWQVRMDHDFEAVIRACADSPREGQRGTWIVPEMVQAYTALHRAGVAHSVETWHEGQLVGGLYLVNLGGMVFGESMFSTRTDASKFALCALVAFCHQHGIGLIDCQQNTAHLASMGAAEMPRPAFLEHVKAAAARPSPRWHFDAACWQPLLRAKAI
jgi:leucyl/phenylalanyl-tRNA---protein transferase